MSLSLFIPLNTLEKYDTQQSSQSDVTQALLTLSQLDVNSLEEKDLLQTSNFWCKILSQVKYSIATSSIALTNQLITTVINLAETAILLHLRLKNHEGSSLEPINTFLWSNDDLFDQSDPPSRYPIRSLKPTENHFMLLDLVRKFYNGNLKIDLQELFSISIEIAARAHSVNLNILPEYTSIFDKYTDISESSLNSDLTPILDKFKDFSSFTYLTSIFIYEYLFDTHVPTLLTVPDLFSRIVAKTTENQTDLIKYLPLIALFSSDPIPYTKNIVVPVFYALMCRNAVIVDENIIFNITEDSEISSILLYALYLNTKKPLIEKFFSQQFPVNINDFIKHVKPILGLSESIEQLIQGCKDGKLSAAKKLYQMKIPNLRFENCDCELITNLKILNSNEIEFDDPSKINKYSHIKLIRLIQLGKAPPIDFINEMLKNLRKQLLESTPKELLDIMMCNCIPDKYDLKKFNIPFPTTIEDFITDLPFDPYLSFTFFIYLAFSFYGKPTTDEMIDLYVDFSLHLLLNYSNCSHLRNFLLQEMPSSFNDKRNQKRKEYAIKAIEHSQNREVTMNDISIVFDDADTTAEMAKYLLEIKDSKALAALINLSRNNRQALISKLTIDMQLSILEILVQQDSLKITIDYVKALIESYVNNAANGEKELNQDKKKLLQILCRNALDHPKIVSSIFTELQLNLETVGEVIQDLPQFSGDISPKFVRLLQNLVSLLPLNPVMLKTPPTIRPIIDTTWEDDEKEEKDSNSKQEMDIWSLHGKPKNCLKDSISQKSCFYCYTCGITNNAICQNCAELCHFCHDLVLANPNGTSNITTCGCGSKCIAWGNHDAFPEQLPRDTREESNISDSAILNLFLDLSKSNIGTPKFSTESIDNLGLNDNIDINQIDFSSFTVSSSNFPFSYKFTTLNAANKIFNVSDFISNASNENGSHFIRRNAVSPYHLMDLVGPVSDILLVCCGHKLYTYSFKFTPDNTQIPSTTNEQSNTNEQPNTNANTNEQDGNAVAGVIDGNSLKLLHQYNIDHVGLQISIFPIDPSVFAIASLHHVSVLTVDQDGSFNHTADIELMLEELGDSLHVNSIAWVPNQMMFLAVACNSFVKIYDVLTDSFSPVAYYVPPSDCFLTSVKFFSYEEKSFALFGLSNGKISIREVCGTVDDISPDGIRVSHYIDLPQKIGQLPIISVSEDGDLIFVSSPNGKGIYAFRISALIEKTFGGGNKAIDMYSIKLDEDKKNALFSFIGNVGTNHYFENPSTGLLISVNFNVQTSSFDVIYIQKDNEISPSSIFEGKMKSMSNLLLNGKVYSISPKTGKLTYLTKTFNTEEEEYDENENETAQSNTQKEDGNDNVDDDNIMFSDDSDTEPNIEYDGNGDGENTSIPHVNENIKVPASFWLNSKPSTTNILITAPNIDGDLNGLLFGSRYIFYNGLKHKDIHIQSTDPNQLIVGFKLTIGSHPHRSPWIKINGRKQTTTPYRSFMLPLKPSEVKPKAINKIELGGNGGLDINCENLVVFVIDQSMYPKKYGYLTGKYDWLNFGTSLFDFVDEKVSYKKLKAKKLSKILAVMNICSFALSGNMPDFHLNEEQLRLIIRIMYSRPAAAEMCRRIIVKLVDDKEKATAIWGNEILKMVEEKAVAKESWALLWRDVSLLPPQLFDEVSPKIWNDENVIDGAFSLITAFMTKS